MPKSDYYQSETQNPQPIHIKKEVREMLAKKESKEDDPLDSRVFQTTMTGGEQSSAKASGSLAPTEQAIFRKSVKQMPSTIPEQVRRNPSPYKKAIQSGDYSSGLKLLKKIQSNSKQMEQTYSFQ